ncbi:MAG: hypothetical protein HOL85_14280 [Rhodospirillaceae bacterium]|jgi:hypothetical protein|nr:hypothetical protein [Rhodospirillaceae bacterium]MBT6136157.1 hypothetical protein [Rhodospirillaceae bacterium]
MALHGNGMLITFTEVPAETEEEFNEWYNREHIDERVWMPGFHRARRYVDATGSAKVKYFATYETDKPEDLSTPAYMALLGDQSVWSKKIMAQFNKFDRLTCKITIDQTHGFGAAVSIARFFPLEGRMDDLRRHMADTLLPSLIARPNMLGAFLAENDLDVSNEGAKAQGRPIPADQKSEWTVILEGATVEAAKSALSVGFGDGLRDYSVAASDIETADYLLMFGNNR